MAHQKARAEDTVHTSSEGESPSSSSGEEGDQPPVDPSTSSKKKKKKKKSKAARALAALRPNDKLHEAIVDQVMAKVTTEGTLEGSHTMDREQVRKALDQMQLGEVLKGKVGIGGKNRKDMGEHKVRRELSLR